MLANLIKHFVSSFSLTLSSPYFLLLVLLIVSPAVLHLPRGTRPLCGGVLPVRDSRLLHGRVAGADVRHFHARLHIPPATLHTFR